MLWASLKSHYVTKTLEYEHDVFKDGFGWALGEYYHGGAKLNNLIGYYETARSQGVWSSFYDGVKEACEFIANTEL